jgi:polyphosphate kinase 2 (PPK2 family)
MPAVRTVRSTTCMLRQNWVAIFNRSNYEDVLITRVHKLVDKPTWTARYDRIRDFELGLTESGTRILKFFHHISKEEQLARFERRLDDPRATGKSANRTIPSAPYGINIWRLSRMPSLQPARAMRLGT